MAIPTFNVGGLLSGLDTNGIVSQLMQLERQPMFQLQRRQSDYETKNKTWDQIATKLNGVQDKLDTLKTAADWQKFTAVTSSNEDAVTVTTSGSASVGSATFTVNRLATTHQSASTGTFASITDLVGAGDLTITVDGTDHTITTNAATTVSDVINQIKSLDVGVSASLLFTGTTEAKLVLKADESGADASFTTATDITSFGSFGVVEQGVDAQLTVGSGPGALTVERSTNIIDDFIEGATITLKATTASTVDVSMSRDPEAAAKAVKELVDSINGALSTIATATKPGTEDTAGGPLSTDATARNLAINLRASLSSAVSAIEGDYRTASSVGISLTREGTYTLDEAKLKEALADDFDAVVDLFERAASVTDSRIGVAAVGSGVADGTYAVEITQAASIAEVIGPDFNDSNQDDTFTIEQDGVIATVSVPKKSTITEVIDAMNQALTDAGISTVSASQVGNTIRLGDTRYGSAHSFTVSANDYGLDGTFQGTDVAGTIGGLAATGSGRSLTGTDGLSSMVLSIGATPAEVAAAGGTLSLGDVSVSA
ncbi:MAG: flagellar filament capping protein FliD, partial [Acidimicrobiia bacterium]|nr:flagellar filament capping protein FliD [Acidimicrobiia bacterium]